MSHPPRPPSVDEAAAIGAKLEVRLPAAYIEALVHYPFPLESDLAEVVLFPQPTRVVEANEYRRKHGFFGHAWPRHFLIIGGMGNGDVIFLDTTREAPVVLVADHELSSGAEQIAIESLGGMLLPEWLPQVLRGWQEARRDGNVR